MALINIIMPLYNKAPYVGRAIRSIQYQTFRDWKLWVVDDGSTDDGPEVVRRFDDPRIEVIHQANQGPGAARNTGIARADSKYLAFLDGDDEWYPWYLENALRAMRENDVSLVGTYYYEWPNERDMTECWSKAGYRPGRYQLQGDEDPAWIMRLTTFFSPWNTFAYTETIRKYGCFFAKDRCLRAEDETLFIRILFNEAAIIIGPPAIRYHTETSSIAYPSKAHPLEPFLAEPKVLLDYCPVNKLPLMERLLDLRALLTATDWAYFGEKQRAADLLNRFPGAKRCGHYYRRYLYYAYIRPRWWTRFKCWIGPKAQGWLRPRAQQMGIMRKAPRMPYEEGYQ